MASDIGHTASCCSAGRAQAAMDITGSVRMCTHAHTQPAAVTAAQYTMQNNGGAAVLQVGEEPDAAFGAGAASVGGSRPGSRKAAAPRQQGRKQVCFVYQVIVLREVTCRTGAGCSQMAGYILLQPH
jgi:hypothetical protein